MTRVLVVEDSADLAYGLRNNLEIEGYTVDLAEDGRAGLDAARRTRPDLVILDLMLPELDGFRVLKALRAESPSLPILILTARGEEADKVRGLKLGADDYVTKPFGLLELLARANKTLNLGGFEYDLDRERLVFRITNLFDKERYDADIVSSMVHCAVAELDRLAPYAMTVVRTPEDLLDDLDLKRLLQRDDLIPPVPGDEDDYI